MLTGCLPYQMQLVVVVDDVDQELQRMKLMLAEDTLYKASHYSTIFRSILMKLRMSLSLLCWLMNLLCYNNTKVQRRSMIAFDKDQAVEALKQKFNLNFNRIRSMMYLFEFAVELHLRSYLLNEIFSHLIVHC